MKRITMLLGAGILILSSMLYAAVPQLINFQGILRDGSGNPVANASYSVVFTIYDAPAGGTNLWTETQSVTTTGGLFTVLLGSVTPVPAAVFDNPDRWLGVKVGADPEMTPRQRLSSVSYSYNSSEWTSAGQNLFRLSGNVGIGTATPSVIVETQTGIDQYSYSHTNGAIKLATYLNGFYNSGMIGTVSDHPFQIYTSNSGPVMTLTTGGTSGNVGIGTTSPASRLDVAGGNFNLENSTLSAGNILKGGDLFIHNFGADNTFIGRNAGNLTISGSQNTAIGVQALTSNATGVQNTASGFQALFSNTTGGANTASGVQALFSNTGGFSNTASGYSALGANTTGNANTAAGMTVLARNTVGAGNTAIGASALFSNTTGDFNTASGASALESNTTGDSNTASGFDALRSNTTGSNNTAIGFGANVSAGNLTNATVIGAGATVNASNKIRLGNAAVTVIEGQVAYTFPSDKNQKENFRPVDGVEVLRKIRGLELSSWNYRGHDPKQFRHYGPTAQDFFAAFGDDGVGKIGTETTLNSGDVSGILMIAVKELGNENAGLKTRIEHLEAMLKEMQAEKPQAKVR